jgi:hypothetical protein
MNTYEMFQMGLSIIILTIFLGYTFHIFAYIFGVHSVIDERLRRYASPTENSRKATWISL